MTWWTDEEIEECSRIARANGFDEDEAVKCNAGSLQCKGCPCNESMREEAMALEIELQKGEVKERCR
jgi:hypothetical protein